MVTPFPTFSSPGQSPSPSPVRGIASKAVFSTLLWRDFLDLELIVLALTCFNRTKVSINHFLVALLITALC